MARGHDVVWPGDGTADPMGRKIVKPSKLSYWKYMEYTGIVKLRNRLIYINPDNVCLYGQAFEIMRATDPTLQFRSRPFLRAPQATCGSRMPGEITEHENSLLAEYTRRMESGFVTPETVNKIPGAT